MGFGYDAHPLVAGRPLVLGGVEVPFALGLAGHSDGDVLVHAIMDAVLGVCGLGDKGTQFPSSDPTYKDISSLLLLERVAALARQTGWRIANIDATMLAQRPLLGPFIQSMKSNVGTALSIPEGTVSIKATTTDHLGYVGREEGMAAYAVALVEEVACSSTTPSPAKSRSSSPPVIR